MKTKLVLIICCCLLLCIVNTTQATELEPSIIHITLIGGDIKNITINVTGVETIYLEHEILPDHNGINITYPSTINPMETQSFNMTIIVAINIAPNNYTIILKYSYETLEEPVYEETITTQTKTQNLPPYVDPEDDTAYPIIHPNLNKPYHPYFSPASDDEPSNNWLYFPLLLIATLVVSLIVLYLHKRKGGDKKG